MHSVPFYMSASHVDNVIWCNVKGDELKEVIFTSSTNVNITPLKLD